MKTHDQWKARERSLMMETQIDREMEGGRIMILLSHHLMETEVRPEEIIVTSQPVEDQHLTREGSKVSLEGTSQLRFDCLRTRFGKMVS